MSAGLTKMGNDPFRAHSYPAAHPSADDYAPENQEPEPTSTLDSESVGKQLKVTILRGGKPSEVTLTIAERGR